jgi:hypothetical protein
LNVAPEMVILPGSPSISMRCAWFTVDPQMS